MNTKSQKQYYVLCINNENYPASLEIRKIYQCIPDPQAESHNQIKVVDESGEDYLYPQELFLPIKVPEQAVRAFAHRS